jgi:uncharacterized protein (DUF983 family)
MYCISCGKSIEKVFNFCNNCGADVSFYRSNELSEASVNLLVATIMIIPLAGLAVVVSLMSVMNQADFANGTILIAAFLCFLLLSGAETVLIRLLQKYTEYIKEKTDGAQPDGQTDVQANVQIFFRP